MTITHLVFSALIGAAVLSGCSVSAAAPDPAPELRLAQAPQLTAASGNEELKFAALEALMTAPSDRALPLIEKVLASNDSTRIKARALFILSQIDLPRAQALLLDIARDDAHPLRNEAIRMIGIGGKSDSLSQLGELYRRVDPETRNSILSAYLIAGDPGPVLQIARDAEDDEEFSSAVRVLGAMGATRELRMLQASGANAKGLVQAYAIAGDLESLQVLARQADDEDQRAQAIRSIGIIGGAKAQTELVEIYKQAGDDSTRSAALQGLLISGHDQGVLALFRASTDPGEKRELLRTLVNMNSDLALEVIDATLQGGS